MKNLEELSRLLRQRNRDAGKISSMFKRAAEAERLSVSIASRIFGIELKREGSVDGIDGYFTTGELAGKGVTIRWYARNDGTMAIHEGHGPDFYLVMTGPKAGSGRMMGVAIPWCIDYVYLIRSEVLVRQLKMRGVELSSATKVPSKDWSLCEVYPESRSSYLSVSDEQRAMLELFGSRIIGS